MRFDRLDERSLPLRVALSYQVCNEQACFPPVTKELACGRE